MLLVDARVGPSPIHGLGLIAHEPIAAGTVVWRLEPTFDVIVPEAAFVALPRPARRTLAYFAVFDPQRRHFVLSVDDDRFTNHAEHPNRFLRGDEEIAGRDIARGEEITCDYRTLGWTQFCGMPARLARYAPPQRLRDLLEPP